ncbi:tryptophan 2,3-dioxygenase family protein [Microlunatus soli]|uniref:Tryptophan 2,3-dioxygenase apoenzyme n=1 Tax=Microlunatus soli TaxID=630515 RepID=A0A1H1VV27_9ACTN|nr:tryptophan 2,3-dioxygenase family protein [Microlunatus soli]SDS88764.1 Tryptophan 2,3-dioxygenase apoenzyme [Microlunatus soli]
MTALTYASYLRLAELLELQQLRAAAASPAVRGAEHLFIVAHQASELWVRQLLTDLEHAASALEGDDPDTTAEFLRRMVAVGGLLRAHLDVLGTMPGHRFADFRGELGTASGAQSRQFRQLDSALGLRRDHCRLMIALQSTCDRHRVTLTGLLSGGADGAPPALCEVARLMVDVARSIWQWKVGHLQLVAGMLGTDCTGTGGSSGTGYLGNRLDLPFPELFEALSAVQRPGSTLETSSQPA